MDGDMKYGTTARKEFLSNLSNIFLKEDVMQIY